jgi:hypothetical protein
MANQKHYDLLKQGVDVWNAWREKHRDVHPDLSGAYLSGVHLSDADLSNTNLSYAVLSYAVLSGAHLSGAHLSDAVLSYANLSGAHLSYAVLSYANLDGAVLSGAVLSYANLDGAHLGYANLGGAHLSGAHLSGTNFRQTRFMQTVFAWADLRLVKELETARHDGPSSVDINSVILPHDEQTRLHFLRGVGFTETQIEYLPSLLTPRPIEYQSLFISYASQDEAIAQRLHADLRKKDVPCWFAPHDLKPGDYFREEIEKAIHIQERLLLILSKDSVISKWVKYEVNRARNREIEQDRTILYPIRLDDTVLNSTSGWAADLRAYRHIGDFTGWQDGAAYEEAFTKLLQHFKVTQPPAR